MIENALRRHVVNDCCRRRLASSVKMAQYPNYFLFLFLTVLILGVVVWILTLALMICHCWVIGEEF
jgi:hypothetical protein